MRKVILTFMVAIAFVLNAAAQDRTITGRITDDKGQPVQGVSVTSSDGKNGTQTDKDGNYSIKVAANAKTLTFSSVNFTTVRRPIGTASVMTMSLSSSIQGLDEVVVVGYGVQQKKAFTGSASRIETKQFSNLLTPSIDKQLAGRATGVQVTTASGLVNQPARIRVRGVNSISQTADPLIVVDGIPIITGNLAATTNSNAIGDINPSDIENIEVLKDGSATAIYGSRAANGVILITTKKGTKGQSRITLESYVGFSNPLKRFQLLNASEFTQIENEKLVNAGLAPRAFVDAAGTNTDWQSIALNNNAPTSNTTLSLSGATDKTNFYFSLNFSNQKGVIISNFNKAYRVRMNIEHELNKYIKVGNNITLSRQEDGDQNNGNNSLGGAIAAALRLPPSISPYSTTHPSGYNINFPVANSMNPGANLQSVDDNYSNIAFTLNNNRLYSDKYRIIVNSFVELSPVKGLKFRSQFSPDMLNDYSYQSLDPRHGDGYTPIGLTFNVDQNFLRYTWQNYFNYNYSTKGHSFFLTAGHEVQKQTTKFFSAQGTGIADLFFIKENTITGAGAIQTIGGNFTKTGFESLFGRINYDYKSKYFAQASIRRDGQSSLAPGRRYGTFPGYSVGWRASEEKGWSSNRFLSKFIPEFKLKASYAKVGNSLAGFPYLTTFGPAPYGNIGGIALNAVGYEPLQWETSAKYDFGIDASIWKNKIHLTADYFLNDIDNLVLAVPAPLSAGVPGNAISRNIGRAQNKGYELAIQATLVHNENFNWDVNFNYSSVKNKIKELYAVSGKPVDFIQNGAYNLIKVGEPINIIYGYQYAGVNTSNGNPMYVKADGRLVQHNIPNGAYYYANSMNDPTLGVQTSLTFDDRKKLGQGVPTWFGGFGTTLSYKNFSMDVFFRYSGGNQIMNQTRQEALLSQSFHNNGREILERWTTPGQVTNVPKLYAGQSNNVNQVGLATSRFVEDGDYLRLQNLVLSYTLDGKVFKKSPNSIVKSLRFFVQGQNLMVWTKYKGVDPDNISALGLDQATSPQVRIFSTGVSVVF